MRRVLPALLVCTALATAQEIGMKQGQVHPDFRLPKVDGGFGRLSDYRGKKVLLFNFASW